jgi:hypothetical protein
LPAGEYYAEAYGLTSNVNSHSMRLYDVTNGVAKLSIGQAGKMDTSQIEGWATISGRFSLAGTAQIELQHRCTTTRATDGFGYSVAWASVAMAELKIWKVA